MNNSLQLYYINKDIEDILFNSVDEETGEILPEAFEKIEALELKKEDLIHNVGLANVQAKMNESAVSEEIKRLQAIKKSLTSRKEAAKRFLEKHLEPGTKFEFDNLKISWRKSQEVVLDELTEVDDLPDEFVRVKKEVDKTAIKNSYKATNTLPEGVKVIDKQNIQIK